ncbi:MAG: PorT family protein [Flavobacteriales bacterium]|nr:PorT family protein [Flavobacteriales bacterium]
MRDFTNRDELDSGFRSAFEDFEPEVNEHIWSNIERELHPAKKKELAWWQWAAAASLVLALSYLGFDHLAHNEELAESMKSDGDAPIALEKEVDKMGLPSPIQPTIPAEENNSNTLNMATPPNRTLPEQGTKKTSTPDIRQSIAMNRYEKRHNNEVKGNGAVSGKGPVAVFPPSRSAIIMDVADSTLNDELAIASVPRYTKENNNVNIDNNSSLKQDVKKEVAEATDVASVESPEAIEVIEAKESIQPLEPVASPPTSERWILAANVLSMAGATAETGNNASVLDNSVGSSFNNVNSAMLFGTPEASYGSINYLPPLITSLTVNYQINKRWSVESGIAYSALIATRESPVDSGERSTVKSKLNYIGIPLVVSFKLITNRKFVFYASIGGTFDKGISAKRTYSTFKNGDVISELNTRSNIPGINISSVIGLGLDYRIAGRISYYLQPGLTAQIVGDGNAYNVRNSKLIWPNVTTGLRFHLGDSR